MIGTVNKGELICILSDLGVLDGLSPDDASKALELYAYRKADDNGDGRHQLQRVLHVHELIFARQAQAISSAEHS